MFFLPSDCSSRERERERERAKCSYCGTSLNSSGKCYTPSCVNYQGNPPSKLRKGTCSSCGQKNVLLINGYNCFKCITTKHRLEFQEVIKEDGLKTVQIHWENILKPQLEGLLRNAEQNPAGLGVTEEEKRKAIQMFREFIQILEDDIYPDRKRNRENARNWLIGGGIAGVIILVGLIAYFLGRNRNRRNRYD